jgi:hypothetical protein
VTIGLTLDVAEDGRSRACGGVAGASSAAVRAHSAVISSVIELAAQSGGVGAEDGEGG